MNKGHLVNLVRQTEKELFRVSGELRSLKELNASLDRVYDNLSEIEEAVALNPGLGREFEREIKSKRLIALLKEAVAKISAFKYAAEENEEKAEKANAFVEKYVTSRAYSFESEAQATDFLNQLLSIFGVNALFFSPEFIGTIDLNAIEKEQRLRRAKHGLVVPAESIGQFIKYLAGKGIRSGMRFHTAQIRIAWKSANTIVVESSKEKLQRLDRLCLTLRGTCMQQ